MAAVLVAVVAAVLVAVDPVDSAVASAGAPAVWVVERDVALLAFPGEWGAVRAVWGAASAVRHPAQLAVGEAPEQPVLVAQAGSLAGDRVRWAARLRGTWELGGRAALVVATLGWGAPAPTVSPLPAPAS